MASEHIDDPGDEQLSIFGSPGGATRPWRGIPQEVARACVSPGWWSIVRALYRFPVPLTIMECREVEGVLRVDAALSEDIEVHEDAESCERSLAQGYPLGLQALRDDLCELLERIGELASDTCACCGQSPAQTRPVGPSGRRRVLCDGCHEPISAGVPLLALADRYWHLDGTRRIGIALDARRPAPDVRAFEPLPARELRAVITAVRTAMAGEILGQEAAVSRLALMAGLHVGGGLSTGPRALILGPSGVGKTSMLRAMHRALADAGWAVPYIHVDAVDLNSPGWAGGVAIHELIAAAIGDTPLDGAYARHAIVVIDELHHVSVAPGAELTGNMAAKRNEVLASLLSLVGGGSLRVGQNSQEWDARHAMVFAAGAFTGLLDVGKVPAVGELTQAGVPLELASRFEETILLRTLGEGSLAELLRRWPALLSLTGVCERLGYTVVVHPETITRAARAVVQGIDGATPRTAGGWLVSALRDSLMSALADPRRTVLQLAPDSLEIARGVSRRPPGDSPGQDAMGAGGSRR